jgi:uncharacterized protein
MTYLPDVNVWVALAAERHSFHLAARSWFGNLTGEKLTFCRITQLGFLRLLTNKHVMQEDVVRPVEAWDVYRMLRLNPRIGYLPEPEELHEDWRVFTEAQLTSSTCGLTHISAPLPTAHN